jgi:hypothetical protein
MQTVMVRRVKELEQEFRRVMVQRRGRREEWADCRMKAVIVAVSEILWYLSQSRVSVSAGTCTKL